MSTTDLLGTFRSEVYDTVEPYLWADTLIYTYIDDAQKMFCRLTYGIEDSQSFQINIAPGIQWYPLDPTILKLRSVIDTGTGDDVPLVAIEKMNEMGMKFDGSTGPPTALVTGMQKGYVRAYPIPYSATAAVLRTNLTAYAAGAMILLTANDLKTHYYTCSVAGTTAAAQGTLFPGVANETITDGTAIFVEITASVTNTLELRTFRLPFDIGLDSDFEIDPQHVLPLLMWVKYKAYSIQDAETRDDKKAATNKDGFEKYCAAAKVEQSRMRRPVSSVSYGGLPTGSSGSQNTNLYRNSWGGNWA